MDGSRVWSMSSSGSLQGLGCETISSSVSISNSYCELGLELERELLKEVFLLLARDCEVHAAVGCTVLPNVCLICLMALSSDEVVLLSDMW